MSSRNPENAPLVRTATRRLSCRVISSSASKMKSSASTAMTSKWHASRTGVSSGKRFSTTAFDRFMPVITPVRPASSTNSALMLASRIRWPACSRVAPPSMVMAGPRLASRTRARITLSTPSDRCPRTNASSLADTSE